MSTQTTTRADRLADLVAERGLDALLVTGLANVRWLTGFTGSSALALVGAGPDGVRVFLTDFRYLTQSAEQVPDAWAKDIAQELLPAVGARLPEGDAASGQGAETAPRRASSGALPGCASGSTTPP